MKTNNLKAVSTEPRKEAVIFTNEITKERVIDFLLATAGRVSMIETVVINGECLCSKGTGQAGVLSVLEQIECDMFKAVEILENKERDE